MLGVERAARVLPILVEHPQHAAEELEDGDRRAQLLLVELDKPAEWRVAIVEWPVAISACEQSVRAWHLCVGHLRVGHLNAISLFKGLLGGYLGFLGEI